MIHNHEFVKTMVVDGNGIYRLNGKVVVPVDKALRERVIKMHHDLPSAGHRGITKTLKLVERSFWWPTLTKDVTQYVSTCDMCQRMKANSQKKAGLLQPLSVPKRPWQSVSMDLITGLSMSNGYDSILVFVD